MKLGKKREVAAAHAVAEERKLPRPLKELVISRYEDAKGKPTTPALVRRFWVVGGISERICVHVDGQGKEHRFPIARGELDFTSRVPTVQDIEYDADGKVLTITDVSHEAQYKLNTKGSNWDEKKFAYIRGPKIQPMSMLCRFNVHPQTVRGQLVRKLPEIVQHWQAQADSPDATWVDGKEPSVKQMTELLAEWDSRGKKEAAKEAVNAPTGPTDPSEMDGEDWQT